ncbi:SDR family oxidoreductase [Frigoribacterium sp. UYMn621]|jgi:meso-butanediol dehydrogenase/(S,S)-butanediol dehydrogenase/diacetyl reductase|uniref:SDR family NAD(P)-dependent oxidoreductase n=1 Tax=Frigoribacterium sp. UYMn621 TaxID=3156343 RepID=UPI003398BAD9
MDATRLAGKNVLITGGAQGMGAAIGKHLAAQGAKICIGDLNLDGARAAADEIIAAGGEATSVSLNVTDRESAAAAVAHTAATFGSINVLLNNAGINKPMFFLEATQQNWDAIMGVNAFGTFLCMQEAGKVMREQGKQDLPYKIVNVGSILSRDAFIDSSVYAASKHAVLGLIRAGARSLVEYNITVNGYAPGVVRTEMWEQLDKELVEMGLFEKAGTSMDTIAANSIPMGRYSYPEDIVGTAAFLVSSDSDYMTGQLIQIDGGMVMA